MTEAKLMQKFKVLSPSEMYRNCEVCGACAGIACTPREEGVHGTRIEDFIENGTYEQRLEAHIWTVLGLRSRGVHVEWHDSIYLSDEELLQFIEDVAKEKGLQL